MDNKTLKQLIKLTLLIIVISFVVDKIIFYSINKVSDKVMTGQAIGKLNHFLSVKDSTDFLVFGNSRANRHIDVDVFTENGFNIGIDGTGIAYISTLINTLDASNNQFILIHIDAKDFFKEDYDGSDIRALKTKYNRNELITKALKKSGHISSLQDVFYSMNYNGNIIGVLKNYFRPKYDYTKYNGYDPIILKKSQEEARDAVLNAKDVVECTDDLKFNPIALEYLLDIKSYLSKSNKTFLFITSPIYNDTCSIDNKKLSNFMKANQLPYLDFSNHYKNKKTNVFWKDRTHMTKQGAEDFSKFLKENYKILLN